MKYKVHPVAATFPMMAAAELAELTSDIRKNGLREPLVLANGMLIDGRNRLQACIDAGVTPHWRDISEELKDQSITAFVVSANLRRRHLDKSQRAMLAVTLLPELEKEAKERQIAGLKKGDSPVPAKVPERDGLTKEEFQAATANKQVAEVDAGIDKLDDALGITAGESREKAAAVVGVSPRMVSDAKSIEAEDPQLAAEVARGEKTVSDAKKEIKRRKRRAAQEARRTCAGTPDLPTDNFAVILADPPWRYQHCASKSREIENHYPTMDLDEICRLDVPSIAAPNCVLFLWATSPKLAESVRVLESWGFDYRTCMVWDKEKIGMGYYARQQHELLLIAIRGKPTAPDEEVRPASVVRARRGEHSRKPEVFRELIERMYPDAAKVELFCRDPRPGWATWGNEV